MAESNPITIRRGQGAESSKPYIEVLKLPRKMESARVRFDIFFDEDFDFACRGKIGGFFVGPGRSQGGEHARDGSSFRVMWDAGGGAYMYVYTPKGSEKWQTDDRLRDRTSMGYNLYTTSFPDALRRNGWRTVTMGIKLNTFASTDGQDDPKPDGQLYLQVDGAEETLDNVVMRLNSKYKVDKFVFNLFHGGPCKAPKTMHVDIRNVELVDGD